MVFEEGSFVVLRATLISTTSSLCLVLKRYQRSYAQLKSHHFLHHPPRPNLSSSTAKDIGVTSLDDAQDGATEELTAGGTKLNLNGNKK